MLHELVCDRKRLAFSSEPPELYPPYQPGRKAALICDPPSGPATMLHSSLEGYKPEAEGTLALPREAGRAHEVALRRGPGPSSLVKTSAASESRSVTYTTGPPVPEATSVSKVASRRRRCKGFCKTLRD